MSDALEIFPPTRDAGLAKLADFVAHAGQDYADRRGQYAAVDDAEAIGVSALSPYLRCGLLNKTDVLAPVIAAHGQDGADKFIAEVFWRTYWTGWLALRPARWQQYQQDVWRLADDVQTQSGLRLRWEEACLGQTGIAAFDHFAIELARTGYLHNHARMWFASIWVHTLRLPWQLGAEFFLRHLLDGDPASNTLSWRWVAGIQTMGKPYLATSQNIAACTNGRFARTPGLAEDPADVTTDPHPEPLPLPALAMPDPGKVTGLLLHPDDLDIGPLVRALPGIKAHVFADPIAGQTPWQTAPHLGAFRAGAYRDTTQRWKDDIGPADKQISTAVALADWARAQGLEQIVASCAPFGPVAGMIADYRALADAPPLVEVRKHADEVAWPLATKGFFPFRRRIPDLIDAMGL
jgi:deoxyribodipyrimidine photo-lyase